MSLGRHTANGVLWNFAQLLSQRIVNILVTMTLARFLVPEDFGLMATMAVFVNIASVMMASGLKDALIRKPSASQTDLSTVFFSNVALGILAYGVLFAAAPAIAGFYEQPRLAPLLRVAGLSIVISSLQVVQLSVLSRALNFRLQIKASVPSVIVSGLAAVGLAASGWGVWALVAQTLLSTLLNTVLLFGFQRWHPSLAFSVSSLREMAGFGYKVFFANFLDLIFYNLFVIVIAKYFAAAQVGYFFFAEKIRNLLMSQLVYSIQNVTYPALARFQDDDARLKAGYQRIIKVTTFLLFPAMLFMAALAQPFIRGVLPAAWEPAILFLQLMCLSGLSGPLVTINLNILRVKGRGDYVLLASVLKKVVIVGVLAASLAFGIEGVLVGQIVSSLIGCYINAYFAAKCVDYPMREQVADLAPALALSTAIAAMVFGGVAAVAWHPLVKLVVFGAGAVVLYFAGAVVFRLQGYRFTERLVRERIAKFRAARQSAAGGLKQPLR